MSGVMRSVLSEMLVFADSSGMQIKVSTGEVLIEGHWGQVSAQKTLVIAAAHATLARRDRVVARCDFVNNVIELDVVTGTAAATPTAPSITRNSSVWELSLAEVQVGAAVSTIAAGNVTDTRFYGGAVGMNVTDDLALFGDKYSTCRRLDIVTDTNSVNGDLFANRMKSNVEHTITTFRVYLGATAQVAGTFNVAVFKGWRVDDLTRVASTTITMTSGTNTFKEATFSPITIEAGAEVVAAYLQLAAGTSPTLGKSASVQSTQVLNPGTTVTSAAKNGVASMPTTMNLLDGTWGDRSLYTWVALA